MRRHTAVVPVLMTAGLMLASVKADASPVVLRTASQDNAVVKYNHADKSKPGICWEIMQKIEAADPSIAFSGIVEQEKPILRIESMLEKSEIDVYFCLVKSPEREARFNYVDVPLYLVKHVVAVKADDPVSVKNFEDIRKLGADGSVLVTWGSALTKVLKAENIKIDDGAKSDEQNFKKLLSSRARFFYGQDMTLSASIKNLKLENKVKILDTVFKEEPQYLTVSKSLDPAIVAKLKGHLERMQKSGELQRIAAKYK